MREGTDGFTVRVKILHAHAMAEVAKVIRKIRKRKTEW
jgi:hypothetical protein